MTDAQARALVEGLRRLDAWYRRTWLERPVRKAARVTARRVNTRGPAVVSTAALVAADGVARFLRWAGKVSQVRVPQAYIDELGAELAVEAVAAFIRWAAVPPPRTAPAGGDLRGGVRDPRRRGELDVNRSNRRNRENH